MINEIIKTEQALEALGVNKKIDLLNKQIWTPIGIRTLNNNQPDDKGNISLTLADLGGTTDHGSLVGLTDDDHTQYFNTTRGDARYLKLNQSVAQTVINGVPLFQDGIDFGVGGLARLHTDDNTNLFIGYEVALNNNADITNQFGTYNTAVGSHALKSNTTGYWNIAVGREALEYNTSGDFNVAIGQGAMQFNLAGSYNTATGSDALRSLNPTNGIITAFTDNGAGGTRVTATNTAALSNGVTVNINGAIYYADGGVDGEGQYVIFNKTATTFDIPIAYSGNPATGTWRIDSEGINNTAIGGSAGYSNVKGSGNIFIGNEAGHNETGSNKLFITNLNGFSEVGDRTSAIIYGVMSPVIADQVLNINAKVNIASGASILHIDPNTIVFGTVYPTISSDAGYTVISGGAILKAPDAVNPSYMFFSSYNENTLSYISHWDQNAVPPANSNDLHYASSSGYHKFENYTPNSGILQAGQYDFWHVGNPRIISLVGVASGSDKVITFPNATGNVPLLETANIFTNTNKININSTSALIVEQAGVKNNVFVVDTTNGLTSINSAVDSLGSLTIAQELGGKNAIRIANTITASGIANMQGFNFSPNLAGSGTNVTIYGINTVPGITATISGALEVRGINLYFNTGGSTITGTGTVLNMGGIFGVLSYSSYTGTGIQTTSSRGLQTSVLFDSGVNKTGGSLASNTYGIFMDTRISDESWLQGTVTGNIYGIFNPVITDFTGLPGDMNWVPVTYAYYSQVQCTDGRATPYTLNAYNYYIGEGAVSSTVGTANHWGFYNDASDAHNLLGKDNVKTYFGTGKDFFILYDGTYAQINTANVNPSDLKITCGSQKTVELQNTVYTDLQFPVSSGKVPAANFPNWETFTTNTSSYAFGVDEYIDLQTDEVPHSWKVGTTGHIHLHFAIKTAQSTGANRFAKFSVWIAFADVDEIWAEASVFTAEKTIPTGSGALKHFYLDLGDLTLTNNLIGTQLKARVKRIAATGGTEYADDVYITQVGCHLENDTIGSRSETTK